MGNIGVTEILLIALVALLLFGAGRIADIGKGLGQGIKNFKQGLKEADELDAPKKPEELPAKDDKPVDAKT
jgi:sec-independent protein translocase protein TatA